MIVCDNCKTKEASEPPYYRVQWVTGKFETGPSFLFCSVECLMDWAWKEREAQPKMSKSVPSGTE